MQELSRSLRRTLRVRILPRSQLEHLAEVTGDADGCAAWESACIYLGDARPITARALRRAVQLIIRLRFAAKNVNVDFISSNRLFSISSGVGIFELFPTAVLTEKRHHVK